ncbi:MAG: glycosyltransferase, partial [Nocardioides sp.]
MSTGRRIAYVLPVFDEARGLATFHQALVAAAAQRPDLTFEFVYVDDGSRDSSLEQLLAMRESDPRVTVLALARNFGHQVAVTAGLDAAHASGAD